MDLIYTDENRRDVGVFEDYNLDLAFGADENDFEIVLNTDNHCCTGGCLLYVENTEYGGMIDGIGVQTADKRLAYTGRTWHGILASKTIYEGTVVSGEANAVLQELINALELSNLFTASVDDSGITIEKYTFKDFIDGYAGIIKMLESVNAKLKLVYREGTVIISTVPIVDYSKSEEFDSDLVEMNIEKRYTAVNHLICVEKREEGEETTQRDITHLYIDREGNVSSTQTLSGLQEITEVYEYSGDKEEALEKAKTLLQDYAIPEQGDINLTDDSTIYDIGDIVGARENITGITVSEKIRKKIVTISNGVVTVQYKVGE